MEPLSLKFKVYKVEHNPGTGKIEIFGEIESPVTEEEKIKNPIAEPLYRTDKQIEDDLEHKAAKVGMIIAEQIRMPPGMFIVKKPPLAVVVFVLPEESFNAMGRPTVGDHLPISVFTEKYTEIEPST